MLVATRLIGMAALFALASAIHSPSCPAGTYLGDNNQCITCSTGSTSIAGSESCTCISGYYTIPRSSYTDPFCAACAAGKSSTNNASSCTPCPANTFSISGGLCTTCPSGTSSSAGSSSCTAFSCSAGQYTSGNSCVTCPAGSYSSKGATSCSACPAGTISNAGSNTCAICGGGLIPTSAKNSCSACPANTYSNGNVCSSCPAGTTSGPGSSSCGPQASRRAVPPMRRAEATCSSKPGHKWCQVLSGKGESECVNVLTTLDSCGGCMGIAGDEGDFTGRDCSAIPHVDEVKCEQGRCNILKCRSGYVAGQGICAPVPGHKLKIRHARHDSF